MLNPFFVVFFLFNSTDLSHFIRYGRWMTPDQDEDKASKSGLPAMFNRNYKNSRIDAFWP